MQSINEAAILLSLGSNLGKREKHLSNALQVLFELGVAPRLCSSIYETEPVEVLNQPSFLNLICQIETDQSPETLMETCLSIENLMGRRRKYAMGPRNIDIDILFYGQKIVHDQNLEIPHPRFRNRNFVLVPLEEILPHFKDPLSGKTITNLLKICPDRSQVIRVRRLGLQQSEQSIELTFTPLIA